MENSDPSQVLSNSYFASLAKGGTLLTNVAASGRPSQPNYISLLAGSTLGYTTDANVNVASKGLIDKFESAGVSWKAYMENYPGKCFAGTTYDSGLYARRHNPFISFNNIRNNATRCAKIVPATQLQKDLASTHAMPMYAFYTPNNNHNGHDTSVAVAATWMKSFLPPLLKHPKFNKTLVVVTWDEGSHKTPANKIISILRGKGVVPGKNDTRKTSHYGLLRTIEDNWSLGTQKRFDANATSFLPFPFAVAKAESSSSSTSTSSSSSGLPAYAVALIVLGSILAAIAIVIVVVVVVARGSLRKRTSSVNAAPFIAMVKANENA